MRISENWVKVRLLLFLFVFVSVVSGAEASRIAGITRSEADSLGRETVIYDRTPVTFNTLSRDFLKKVYGRAEYRGLSAEQVVASIRLYPLEWKNEPIILIKDKGLREKLGAKKRYVSLSSLFESDGSYRVEKLYENARGKDWRAVEELDEKAGILLGIISGDLIIKKDGVRLPEWRISLELLYNRIPFLKIIFILLFSAALLAGTIYIYDASSGRVVHPLFRRVVGVILSLSFLFSIANFTLEWILARRIPLSNTGETLSFTVLAGTGLTLLFMILSVKKGERRVDSMGVLSIAMLFWGCVALVSWLIGENPVLTPLMPALQSPWLSIHVTLVMISYALLALTFVIAIPGALGMGGDRLRSSCMTMLYPGVGFLAAGIITGSIWAKDAWGAYWSWDPKETWALITFIAYVVPMCVRIRGRWLYIYLLFAFLTVLMTYFGVNYFLGGRHSYV